jgi:hypothetical protein
MGLEKTVVIDELQPTHADLNKSKLEYYHSIFPSINGEDIPEIWDYNGKLYIQDGHHKLKVRRDYHKIMRVRLFTPENCGISRAVYADILDGLLSGAKEARNQGIFSLNDMRIIEYIEMPLC